jgi:hypothetical protein
MKKCNFSFSGTLYDRGGIVKLVTRSPQILRSSISQIAEKIKVDKFRAGVIVEAIVIGLLLLIAKSRTE